VATQTILIIVRGETFCLNQGCRLVEGLTVISPFYFNILGLAYFQTVFWLSIITRSRSTAKPILRIILYSGLMAEGILLGYQIFVAHSFCSYCLLVFFLVIVLNGLVGLRELTIGVILILAQLVVFSLLKFDATKNSLQGLTLDDGTYAVKSCSDPVKQLYLIFSEDCPHCRNIIRALEDCSRCEFHFNPTKRIKRDLLPGLIPKKMYSPKINIIALKILGIDTIPILIVKNYDGLTFIKGEQNIINYIQNSCFQGAPLVDKNLQNLFNPDEGTCSINGGCR